MGSKSKTTTNLNETVETRGTANTSNESFARNRSGTVVDPNFQPRVDQATDAAFNLFDFLGGVENPGFQTFVDLAPETEAGLQGIADRAFDLAGVNTARDAVIDIAGSGSTPADVVQVLQSAATNPTVNSARGFLEDTASGAFLDPASNPQLQAVLDQGAQQTRDIINNTFSRAGRFGSGANQEAVASGVSDTVNRILFDQFNTERDRQIDAATRLGGFEADDVNRSLTAANTVSNVLGSDDSRRLQASALAPGIENAGFLGADRLIEAGGVREAQQGREIDDALSRFNFNIDRETNSVNQLLASLGQLNPFINRESFSDSEQGSTQSIETIEDVLSQLDSVQTTKQGGVGPALQTALGTALAAGGFAFGGPAGGAAASSLAGGGGGGVPGFSSAFTQPIIPTDQVRLSF